MWRRRRDSNPRTSHPVTPLAGERLRPLGHVSADPRNDKNPYAQGCFSQNRQDTKCGPIFLKVQYDAGTCTQNPHSLFTLRFSSFKVLQAQFGVSHAVFQMLILTSGVCIAPDPDPDPDRQVSNLGSATPTEALCGPKGTELA
jgi:hypothetical protein